MKRTAWKTQITGNVDNLKPISEKIDEDEFFLQSCSYRCSRFGQVFQYELVYTEFLHAAHKQQRQSIVIAFWDNIIKNYGKVCKIYHASKNNRISFAILHISHTLMKCVSLTMFYVEIWGREKWDLSRV